MYDLVKDNDIADVSKRALMLINSVDKEMENPEELERTRVKLSRLCSVIGQFEAWAEHSELILDAERKVAEVKAFSNAKQSVEKITVAEANNYAEIEVSELRKQIAEAHYQYRQLRNLRESIMDMNNAIASRLQTLRRELQNS